MDGGAEDRPEKGFGLVAMLLALAIPLLVLAGVGARAAVRHVFAPRPTYGAPPAAVSPLMAWDEARHQVVMVTGTGGRPSREASTWTWDGWGWTQHAHSIQPPVGDGFWTAAAYDPSSRELVVVASNVSNNGPADTWAWDGADWRQLPWQDTVQVRNAALGYDEATGQLVLAGFDRLSGEDVATWILRGSRWVAVPGATPLDQGPLHMAFDRATHRLLLFPTAPPKPQKVSPCPEWGDCAYVAPPPCTGCPVHPLAWNGSAWVASGMTARDGIVVADPAGYGLLDVVGGDSSTRGVWRWDGRRWSRAAGLPVPRAVADWSVAVAADAHQLVLFGGMESNHGWYPAEKPVDQTWTFDGTEWTLRAGHPPPKLPPPSPSPPPSTPSPCTGPPAALEVSRSRDGIVYLGIHLPVSGPPGRCTSVAATVRLETVSGRTLDVSGNPTGFPSVWAFGGDNTSANATWSNWCGRRTGLVMRLSGAGFDVTEPVLAPPLCTSSGLPSTLTTARPMVIP